MARTTHEVDPTTQAALLPPSSDTPHIEIGGGYYELPTPRADQPATDPTEPQLIETIEPAEAAIPTEVEQQIERINYELKALNNFARENSASANKTHQTNRVNKIADTEGDESDMTAPARAAEKSAQSVQGLRRAAKINFARSIGINAYHHTEYVYDENQQPVLVDGKPEVVARNVRVDNVDDARRLDAEYAVFRANYAYPRNARRRRKRQKDLEAKIQELSKPNAAEIDTQERMPATAVAADLTAMRGVIVVAELPRRRTRPNGMNDLTHLAGTIGRCLSDRARQSSLRDEELAVYPADFERARLDNLDEGLYITPAQRRERTLNQRKVPAGFIAMTQKHAVSSLSPNLPGIQPRYTEVMFAADDYSAVARHPYGLGDNSIELVESKRKDELEADTLRSTSGRAAVHSLDDRMQAMGELDQRLLREVRLLEGVIYDAFDLSRQTDVGRNLLETIQGFSELFHATVQLAAYKAPAEYNTTEIGGIHLAHVSDMFRTPDLEDRAVALMERARWARNLRTAQRDKISRSLNLCEHLQEVRYPKAA